MIEILLYEALNNYVNFNESLNISSVLSNQNKKISRRNKKTKEILKDIDDSYTASKTIKHRKKKGEINPIMNFMYGSKDHINSDILRDLIKKEVIRMKYGDKEKGERNLKRLINFAHQRYDKKGSLIAKIFNRSDFDLAGIGEELSKSDIKSLPFHHLHNLITMSMPITRNINKLVNDTNLGPELSLNKTNTIDH